MPERDMTRPKPVYWIGTLPLKDDFGIPYKNIMIDGRLKGHTQWANMTEQSWRLHGIGQFGTGLGQMYEKQPDGRWLKIKG